MSAQPIPPPEIHTSIKAICRVPLSFFEKLLDWENYTELRCFSLILCQSVGSGRMWAEIDEAEFIDASTNNKNKHGAEYVMDSIDRLAERGLINIREREKGHKEYRVNDWLFREAKAQKIHGKCPDCQAVGYFKTEFIPVFHLALRKLGACVEASTFRVVMAIIRHTARWDKDRGFYVVPAELERDDIERMTGLETRSVSAGISEAKGRGLVGVHHRLGKPSLYWVIPEGFQALERRQPKKVTPIDRGKKKTNPDPPKPVEKPTITPKPRANESGWKNYALCESCGHFVDPEIVAESKLPTRAADKPQRAGPTRETRPPDRQDAAWDTLKKWHTQKTILKA